MEKSKAGEATIGQHASEPPKYGSTKTEFVDVKANKLEKRTTQDGSAASSVKTAY